MLRVPPSFACIVLLTTALALTATAQEPKKAPPKPKFTPAQIAEAEFELQRATCHLNRPKPKREPWEELLPRPPEAPAPVDLVGFPNDTTDADLARLLPFVKRLPGLKAVMLWNSTKITAKGLKVLAKELPDLQGLVLNNVKIADADLAELAGLQRATWVHVIGCPIRDAGVKELTAIPCLASLSLIDVPGVSAEGLERLGRAKNLRELVVDIRSDPGKMVVAIAGLSDLTSLHVFPVSDDDAAELGRMEQLTSLDLSRFEEEDGPRKVFGGRLKNGAASGKTNKLTDAGLRELTGCKSLTTLRVSGSLVTLEKVPELAKLERLSELVLEDTDTNNAGLAVVAKLKALTRLDLSGTRVTDAGVRNLADLPRLEVLDLSSTHVGDGAIEALAPVLSLQSLTMNDTQVAAMETPNLGRLTSLKHLSLHSTNVNPLSVKYLAAARTVLVMDLRQNCPNLTAFDVGPLQAALPKCRVLASSCFSVALGWPGAVGYAFKLPEVKSPPTNFPPPVASIPQPMPVQPPPKLAPPPPVKVGGGSKP